MFANEETMSIFYLGLQRWVRNESNFHLSNGYAVVFAVCRSLQDSLILWVYLVSCTSRFESRHNPRLSIVEQPS